MSWQKKIAAAVRQLGGAAVSGTDVPDTTSGFRAYTREAALQDDIVSEFLVHARIDHPGRKKRMAIGHVEIETTPSPGRRGCSTACSATSNAPRHHVRIYTMYER
jgi:hypothetical protein